MIRCNATTLFRVSDANSLNMTRELIICVPGNWSDRSDIVRQVILLNPPGRYMFAGMILADVHDKDHVSIDVCEADPNMGEAFETAGQRLIPADVLGRVRNHSSVTYLHFPLDLVDQRDRILKYTQLLQRIGGIAVKIESTGIAHTWERWFSLLSGTPFDIYCSAVVLIGDEDFYYSCGMHLFALPECMVSCSVPAAEASDLMNRFNFWQISERPKLDSGHTFSLTESSPNYRLTLENDSRHEAQGLFHNPNGVWHLSVA
jgi:hypothetical protein